MISLTQSESPLLPPPQPMDQPGTRPPFDLLGMASQILIIQTVLARERAAKAAQEPQCP